MIYYVNPLLYFHSTCFDYNFVFNGINGAVDALNPDLAKLLSENMNKMVDVSGDEVSTLLERNYIFSSEEDYKELRYRIDGYQNDFLKSEPYHIAILPTFGCNLACPYCFEQVKPQAIREDKEYLQCIINALHYFSQFGEIMPELYGGEPLLPQNASIIEGVLSECIKLQIRDMGIITNGTYLKEYSYLPIKYPEIKFNIQITVDGPRAIHNKRRVSAIGVDTFALIMEGIDSIIDCKNVFIQIRTNVDDQNAKSISELYEYFEEKYAFYNNIVYYLTPTCDRSCPQNDTSEIYIVKLLDKIPKINGLKKNGGFHVLSYLYSLIDDKESAVPMHSYCEGVRGKYFALAPDGNIYSCGETVGIPHHSIGWFDNSSVNIDTNKLEQWKQNTIASREGCRNCAFCYICGGGCALTNYIQTGKYDGNAACSITHLNVKQFFDYLRDRTF